MGKCGSQPSKEQRLSSPKPTTDMSNMFPTIKHHVVYFDTISLSALNYPDLSLLLKAHIKNHQIVEQGKTWVCLSEIISMLNEKSSTILIRNFNKHTDAALQLIYLLKQLVKMACKVQEKSISFCEDTVELYHYFLQQIVQVGLEVLICTNTMIKKEQEWWGGDYFQWRRKHIEAAFRMEAPKSLMVEAVGSICDFVMLLQAVAKRLSGFSRQLESQDIEFKAQQECLQQFYTQMRVGFLQTQQMQDSISIEIRQNSVRISQNLRTHTFQPHMIN